MLTQLDRALLNDSLYLVLGTSFLTVGIISGVFSLLRGRLNILLIWLSIFAIADGLRLWVESETLLLLLGPAGFFDHIRSAFAYLVPIPAFLYLRDGGFLNKALIKVTYILIPLLVCMVIATLLLGPLPLLYEINCTMMGTTVILFIFGAPSRESNTFDDKVVRRGLLVYLFAVLIAYAGGLFGYKLRLEPYGFAILLACLGYVAATRTLDREEQFLIIEKELDLAKSIQLALLPAEFPASTHFCVEARYIPVTSVAGDLYDFLVADNDKAGLFIADVSGHGIPAALISSMVKLAATSQGKYVENPAQVLSSINTTLCGNTQTQFVTAAYVYLDASCGTLRYSAAGHPPMLHLSGGNVANVEENGLMLAAFPSSAYTTATRSLHSGDRLLLYTDGIIESMNAEEKEFGLERLRELLEQTSHLSTSQVADRVISTIQQWSKIQEDDMTVLVCDYI